jgi:hypothetical protein
MRSAFLFPLSLSFVVVGCGSTVKEPASRSDFQRDLTLIGPARETAVATSLELGQIRTRADSRSTASSQQRVWHRAARRSTVRAAKPVRVITAAPRPTPAPTAVQPTNNTPADPHELPPGKTVTIIPVSRSPSISDVGGPDGPLPPRYGTGGSGMGGGERAGGGSGMGGDCPRPDFGPAIGIRGGTRGLLY